MINTTIKLEENPTPKPAKPLGIAVIGCGYWGMNYVRIFNELAGARVVAVCDQNMERLQEVSRRFPNVSVTTHVEDVAQMADVDAAVVCTEATSHYTVARRLLMSSKDLLVEKPLTINGADAQELINLMDSRSRILMVGHTFLFNAGIRKIKEYVNRGDGRVYYLYARRTNLGPIRRDVNALWDLAPHDIAVFNYLLGSTPKWVSAVGSKVLRNCREDVGFISLGYPDDILANVHVSWADPHKAREIVVVKSDRRIVFDDLNGMEQVRVFEKGVAPVNQEPLNFGEFRFEIREGDIVSPRIEPVEPLKNECKHFLESVRLRRPPLSGGREGLEVVRILEAVNRSLAANGQRIEIEETERKTEIVNIPSRAIERTAGTVC